MKETELGEQIIEWLEQNRPEWDIFQEIRPSKYAGSPVADIVCINKEDDSVWIIELKKNLTLDVVRQACQWDVDYRSIAVIGAKRQTAKYNRRWWYGNLKHKFDVGSLELDSYGNVREIHKPPDRPERFVGLGTARIIELCRSGVTEGLSQAGNSEGGYWTPYKESIKKVKKYIQENPGCGAGDIIKALGKLHYANEHSARTNLVKNLKDVEISWCLIKKKGTYLTFYFKEEK
jgi:hypothetical protein